MNSVDCCTVLRPGSYQGFKCVIFKVVCVFLLIKKKAVCLLYINVYPVVHAAMCQFINKHILKEVIVISSSRRVFNHPGRSVRAAADGCENECVVIGAELL